MANSRTYVKWSIGDFTREAELQVGSNRILFEEVLTVWRSAWTKARAAIPTSTRLRKV